MIIQCCRISIYFFHWQFNVFWNKICRSVPQNTLLHMKWSPSLMKVSIYQKKLTEFQIWWIRSHVRFCSQYTHSLHVCVVCYINNYLNWVGLFLMLLNNMFKKTYSMWRWIKIIVLIDFWRSVLLITLEQFLWSC